MKNDVYAARSFFFDGKLLKSLNHNHIYLIPKVNDTSDMTQVTPISLCFVSYKMISK